MLGREDASIVKAGVVIADLFCRYMLGDGAPPLSPSGLVDGDIETSGAVCQARTAEPRG